MKKYILKKDLPTFKAGEKFVLNKSGLLISCQSQPSPVVVYSRDTLERFPNILEDWFEEIREEAKTVWDLKEGDWFWLVESAQGDVINMNWEEIYNPERSYGDVFLTQYEARRELAWRKARQVLLRDTNGFKPDWGDEDQSNYEVCYRHDIKEFRVTEQYFSDYGTIVFSSEEEAWASVMEHEEEWKTYFGVEE